MEDNERAHLPHKPFTTIVAQDAQTHAHTVSTFQLCCCVRYFCQLSNWHMFFLERARPCAPAVYWCLSEHQFVDCDPTDSDCNGCWMDGALAFDSWHSSVWSGRAPGRVHRKKSKL